MHDVFLHNVSTVCGVCNVGYVMLCCVVLCCVVLCMGNISPVATFF